MKNHYTPQNPTHLGLAWPLRKLLLVFLLLGCTCALHAQTTTWTGATNIDWDTPTNWSTNAVPTVNDNVEVPSAPANQPTLNTAASVKGLRVQSGATLILSATGNLMLPDAGMSNDGTLTNNGTITISTTSQDGVYNTGLFQNKPTGTLRINKPWGNGIWNLNSSSTVINEGKIFIGDTDNTGVSGILNYGTFTNKATGEIHIDRSRSNAIANTSSFTNSGTITIGALVPPGGNAIENLADVATFTNEACALIRAFSNVLNTKGSFTNNGYISVNSVKVPSVPDVLVNSPAGVAGSYTFSQANFGANVNSVNLTANGVFVDDATVPNPTQGCSPPVNAAQLSGKIALIDRGVCNFSQKVYYAQQAGAIGVIMFNNVAGGESMLVTMAPGAFADQITIPTVMLTYEAGQSIRAALAGGPVNISIIQVSLPSPPITNQGVISFSYPLGIPIPNVTNNDIIARSGASCGNTLSPALQLGGSVSLTVGTTWYKDEALTMPAGTYNQQTNTFTITNLAAGVPIRCTFLWLTTTTPARAPFPSP
ncbi:PA domain-containing protein [Salmonirosea aquatica]